MRRTEKSLKRQRKVGFMKGALVWLGFGVSTLILSYLNARVAGLQVVTTEVQASPLRPVDPPASEKMSVEKVVLSATSSEQPVDLSNLFWMGWTHFESSDNYAQTGGDGGHAYGRYQFDDRHCLAEFLQFCVEQDYAKFNCFGRFVWMDAAGELHLTRLEELSQDWQWLCYTEKEAFEHLQTEFALQAYYEPARALLVEQLGIDLEDFSPVLKGTVMSCAIRNGYYRSNLECLWQTYRAGISEAGWLERIYVAQATEHPDQEQRWAVEQKNAALEALQLFESHAEVSDSANFGFEEVIFN